jgi:hypothetical protein
MPVLTDDPLESGLSPATADLLPSTDERRDAGPAATSAVVREIGGPAHPHPTRYGDWELRGRCIDF